MSESLMDAETEHQISSTALDSLFATALAARENAYAPYSNFSVGAAVRTPTGEIFWGANVENAAYPSGCCAETGAIAAMVAAGQRQIADILVVADCDRGILPCGACRQRIAEFATEDAMVHSAGPDGVRKSLKFSALLPEAFDRETLEAEPAKSA
jgi:cytidine deaminase